MRFLPWLVAVLGFSALASPPPDHRQARCVGVRRLSNCRVEFWNELPCIRVMVGAQERFLLDGTQVGSGRVLRTRMSGHAGQVLVLINDYGADGPIMDLAVLDGLSLKCLARQKRVLCVGIRDFAGVGTSQVACMDPIGLWPFDPCVLYRLGPHGLELAPDLMALQPTPDENELRQWIHETRQEHCWPEETGLSWPCIERWYSLVYVGRADLARRFFNASWPAGRAGREAYWGRLVARLRTSRHRAELEKLNAGRL